MRLLGALVLHRDGMPICEATRFADDLRETLDET